MAEEQAASDTPGTLEPVQAQSPANPVRRLTLIVIAIGAALFLHGIATDRLTPYTAQALVQAVNRRARRALNSISVQIGAKDHAGTISRARSRSRFAQPYIVSLRQRTPCSPETKLCCTACWAGGSWVE